MFGLWQVGELTPWVYHGASLLLHILERMARLRRGLTWQRTHAAAL
jgi:hypothetical protein